MNKAEKRCSYRVVICINDLPNQSVEDMQLNAQGYIKDDIEMDNLYIENIEKIEEWDDDLDECSHLMNPETCISCIDEEHNRFEMHCKDDLYFFCPLCEEYHEKTKTTKGEYKTIWWCQIPVRDQEAMIR